ncbi:hypothetical protein AB0K18_37930 [Nonomuraea sp. NPDC049421]|uniref:hypothetical protein n=1 Tax=Nonomuraea sp. NPDC049421 TaxID=3155275 RepID=UPI003437BC56
MEFWKALLGLLTKVRIGPPLIVASILAGLAVHAFVPARHTTDVSLVLAMPVNGGTIPNDKTKQGLTNPFLSFNDALKTGASIVILSMNTQDVWTELGAPKDGPTDIVIDDGRSNPNVLDINGPYIYIQVTSDSPGRATSVLMAARQRVADELAEWQRALGAPPNTFITSTDIVPPSVPEADESLKWQAGIGAGLLVLVLGMGLAYALVIRRPARPVKQPAEPDEPVPPAAAKAEEPEEPSEPEAADEDSSATVEFPAYRGEDLSPVPGPRKAGQDDGEG